MEISGNHKKGKRGNYILVKTTFLRKSFEIPFDAVFLSGFHKVSGGFPFGFAQIRKSYSV